MGFKSFKVVHFEQLLDGFDDDNNSKDMMEESYITWSPGDFGSEFEGLRGGKGMMSLVTLFGGLKNVFKVRFS